MARTSTIWASLAGPGAKKESGGVSGTPAVCTACGSSTPKGVAGAGTLFASAGPPAPGAACVETCAPRTASARKAGARSKQSSAMPEENPGETVSAVVRRPRSRRAGGGSAGRGCGGALRFSGARGPFGGKRAAGSERNTRAEGGPRVAGGTVMAPSLTRCEKRLARAAGRATALGTARSVRCPARFARERTPVRMPGVARGGRAGGFGRAAGRGARGAACWLHRYHGASHAQCQWRICGRRRQAGQRRVTSRLTYPASAAGWWWPQ